MAQSLLYRNCLVAAFVNCDETTQLWTGTADVSWGPHDNRSLKTISRKNTFVNGIDAEHFIIAAAKHWIDRGR